ncbi:glutathione synthase [Limnoraphis robusta]|uniref:Glutathione synthetase n=1 Tax=Limnoraphis robusta CCNP1315 TaxID=3110306 RepID=A0ABU5TT16_9CYAN|nr:glutathione synthase [Limnoraphis robusta]MEA5499692.1 glutathione synthase [Limnoraphis robusta BA-68 BA1]MEA5517842.1 glutathione synthase [Limnoraphis robusta CCNP1315]MEA5546352.1 glutathione synthase [Limnoraphis robusta CCNP1324]
MKFAFIIDPIEKLNPSHDSSVAIMEAAQALGHEVWITEIHQLTVSQGKAWATLTPVHLVPVKQEGDRWISAELWFSLDQPQLLALEEMDAVFMRTDPPVTVPYLYATYILDYVDSSKTLVINSPQGLRAANEKMYALQFTEAIPETIVSQNKQVIREFVEKKEAAVLKPLGGKAGEGILFLEAGDRNFNSLIEISTKQGREPVMVQTYLPAAKEGDKRIILLDGEPIGAINRIPTGKEFRGNMAVGGRVAQTEITDREREICVQVAPKLREDGLYFVGIDVIGGYLTEVNVTSPTGIREIDLLDHVNLGKQVIEWIEKKAN